MKISVLHIKVFQKDNVEKDVCSEDIENTETEKEQLKILEEIKQRNKERMMQVTAGQTLDKLLLVMSWVEGKLLDRRLQG